MSCIERSPGRSAAWVKAILLLSGISEAIHLEANRVAAFDRGQQMPAGLPFAASPPVWLITTIPEIAVVNHASSEFAALHPRCATRAAPARGRADRPGNRARARRADSRGSSGTRATISPPVKRKVRRNRRVHSSSGSGWCAASQPANEPCDRRSSWMRAGVGDHRRDLLAVAHDAGVAEQPGHVGVAERRHPVDIEPGEGGAKRRRASAVRSATTGRPG